MYCSKCGNKKEDDQIFCSNCGDKKPENTIQEKKPAISKDIPWHQNFKWWQILIVSIISLIIYFITNGYIWNYIFLIGIIFTITQFIRSRKKLK